MDIKQFQDDSIKTESKIDAVQVDLDYLSTLLDVLICAGNLLDQIKKNAYYGKPIDPDDRAKWLTGIIAALDSKNLFMDDPTANKQVLDVNTRLFHSIIGIATEGTELLENLATGNIDTINMLEEAGDIGWYQSIMFDEANTDFETVFATIIAKLKARYPNKFTSEDAINRDTKAERKILETMNDDNKEIDN